MVTPSETLSAAADLIRDLAAKAAKGPWHAPGPDDTDERVWSENGYPGGYTVAEGGDFDDFRWIAALSPALAPHLESILRWAGKVCANAEVDGWDRARIWAEMDDSMRSALDLADAILGSGVDTP